MPSERTATIARTNSNTAPPIASVRLASANAAEGSYRRRRRRTMKVSASASLSGSSSADRTGETVKVAIRPPPIA